MLARRRCTLVRSPWCPVVVSSHALRVFSAALSPDQLTRRVGADAGSSEWRSGARPSSYTRVFWWAGTELNRHRLCGAFTAPWARQCPACPMQNWRRAGALEAHAFRHHPFSKRRRHLAGSLSILDLAASAGLEPAASTFGRWRSGPLSYEARCSPLMPADAGIQFFA
jgi:hypothetical protein